MIERARAFVREAGVPRLLIAAFVIVLFSVAAATNMNLASLVTDSIVRVARNGILVLALLPAIQGGLGLNFGLPLGVICGLIGCVI
ncbi:MAG TPA: ABC transporter permease, partial [Candidatus Eisenbacteria bacterium]|nr:ABC transporter permease [Candidatus Eisenbacteria bacterium]